MDRFWGAGHGDLTPRIRQDRNTGKPRGSAIDARNTRRTGYAVSEKKRKQIERCFGWPKDIALLSKLKHCGLFGFGWIFTFAATTYSLVRMGG